MSPRPLRVGLVGCGNISGVYIANARRLGGYTIEACCDAVADRAAATARQHGIPRACTLEEILADPSIELVLNLTPPAAHGSVGLAAADAGKHVYNEKPLAVSLEAARRVLDAAARHGRLVGCAPDTFMGAGYSTCARLLREGAIGTPVGAAGFMMYSGPERWHPDPAFFYARGAGPLFDMGPYYITALVTLFGPVSRVSGLARTTFPTRVVESAPNAGERIAVETPTHVAAVLGFASGPVATLTMSFDVWSHSHPPLEIYGSEGTLLAPDPNGYGGPVRLRLRDAPEFRDIPLDPGHAENSRGLGLADLAAAASEGRWPRASGELAFHVLETMHAVLESSSTGRTIHIGFRPDR